MALVKGAEAGAAVRDAIVLDLGDLRRQGQAIVEAAHAERDRILGEARAEHRRLVESAAAEGARLGVAEGRRLGREAGERAGHAEALARGARDIARLDGAWGVALSEFAAQREAALRDARRDVLTLAIRVAERIVRRTVAADPGVVADQLDAALSLVLSPTRIRVIVNPDDAPLVRDLLPAACAKLGSSPDLELGEDAALERGSVIVRTPEGEIDATLGTQLDRLADAIAPAPGSAS